jgi:hypothetical protein
VSLRAAVERLLPFCSADLVGPDARSKLLQIAGRLPSAFHNVGFETRLAAADEEVDLGVSLRPDDDGALRLCGTGPIVADLVRERDAWRRLSEFSQHWCGQKTLLSSWVPFLFLEFDAIAASDPKPVPSVFVALDAPLDERPDRPHREAAREAVLLLRGDLPRELDAKLSRCFEALPEQGYVLHVGLMLGRATAGLRLSVTLPSGTVVPYLRALGGDAAAAEAQHALREMPGWLTQAQLDFDLDPDIQPRIGFGIRPGMEAGDDWPSLLDECRGLGLCDPAKARALLAWPGIAAGVRRELSHVKLAVTSGRIEAKAYFAAEPTDR